MPTGAKALFYQKIGFTKHLIVQKRRSQCLRYLQWLRSAFKQRPHQGKPSYSFGGEAHTIADKEYV